MPQMAPISWLILFFMFFFTFIIFNILNFFNILNKIESKKKMFKLNNKLNFNWKW